MRGAAAWMVIVAIATAAQGTCIHALGGLCPWQLVVLARCGLGAALGLALVRAGGARMRWRGRPALWIRSVAAALALMCTFFAAARIPVANVTVLLNTAPLWVLLASRFAFGLQLRMTSWLAVVGGAIGIVLVVHPDASGVGTGALLAAVGGLVTAVALLAVGRMRDVPGAVMVAHATSIAALAAAILVVSAWPALDTTHLGEPRTIALLVGVTVSGTAAQLALIRAYVSGSASRLAPLQYLAIAFSALADLLVFGIVPDGWTAAGIGLIVGPLVYAMLRRESAAVRHDEPGRALDADLFHDPAAGRRVEAAIGRAELSTSCEIRVHVERACADRVARPREVFAALGMTRTKLRNGVLVYLALEPAVVAVVVDDGIADGVPRRALDALSAELAGELRGGHPVEVLERGVVEICRALGGPFPYQRDDIDELDNTLSLAL